MTHTGRIPFGLASFVVKKMFLCKVDHCGVEQNSPRLGGKHAYICNCWFQNRSECAEVRVSVESGSRWRPAGIVSMQALNEKELNQDLGLRREKSNILYNRIKSHAASSTTRLNSAGQHWLYIYDTLEDETYPCPRIQVLIRPFELLLMLGIQRMIITTRDNKTARPSSHTTTASVYRFPLQRRQSRSTTSS